MTKKKERYMFNNIHEMIYFIENLKRGEKKENLQYMRDLCALFQNPQDTLSIIHIGGTNGKGSTVTYIKSILLAAGYHVGTFISPYVVCFNERISYDDQYISDDEILYYGNLILARFPDIEQKLVRLPSFFEFMTLLAFIFFSYKEQIDYVVLEVGIGGTLDCTNIVNPIISAVTNVSYDHMNILGNTLEEIWDNKLGIAKPNTPFLTFQYPSFDKQIQKRCQDVNATLHQIDKNDIINGVITTEYTRFDYHQYKCVYLKLLGRHQMENAVLAIEVVNHIKKIPSIPNEAIYHGLKHAFWPGRLEIVSHDPLIVIDGAHNIDGITKLSEFIRDIKGNMPVSLVFAVSANKEKESMIEILEPIVDEMIFTHFMYKRSDDASHLYEISHHRNKRIVDDIDEIIAWAKQNNQAITVFCGSLFFISELRNKLIQKSF